MHETLTMLPLVQARRLLTGGVQKFRLLRPPYPALGAGELRVLRVREASPGCLELTVGYDTYERLG